MKPSRLFPCLVAAALLGAVALGAADSKPVMPTGDAKKLAARYALTKTRIDALLSARQHPTALPATPLPNPFYKPSVSGLEIPQSEKVEIPVVPDAPDLSDIDTLTKYAATLKIGGYLTLGDSPHVAINSIICKVGDVITVGSKDHPIFLRIESITPQEFTLRLNDAMVGVHIRN